MPKMLSSGVLNATIAANSGQVACAARGHKFHGVTHLSHNLLRALFHNSVEKHVRIGALNAAVALGSALRKP